MIRILTILFLGIIVLVAIIYSLLPKYQFFYIKCGGGYMQLRGNTITGELKQIYGNF